LASENFRLSEALKVDEKLNVTFAPTKTAHDFYIPWEYT